MDRANAVIVKRYGYVCGFAVVVLRVFVLYEEEFHQPAPRKIIETANTVKPVYNDHLYNKIYYVLFIH